MDDTLLLVDDEAGIRTVLSISLADMGYTVRTASSGREALELFRIHAPAIVLTDINMPDINGIELLRRHAPRLIPWGWGVNGVASVAGTVTAVILGMEIGFSRVALVALAVYIVGTVGLLTAVRAAVSSASE